MDATVLTDDKINLKKKNGKRLISIPISTEEYEGNRCVVLIKKQQMISKAGVK